jgi:hypothetical protein
LLRDQTRLWSAVDDHQGGVDRGGERGVVQLDRQVVVVVAAGLLPGRAQLGLAGEHPEIGALVAGLVGDRAELDGLEVDGQGADGARERAVSVGGEGADGSHGGLSDLFRAAPIAASMAIKGPGSTSAPQSAPCPSS